MVLSSWAKVDGGIPEQEAIKLFWDKGKEPPKQATMEEIIVVE